MLQTPKLANTFDDYLNRLKRTTCAMRPPYNWLNVLEIKWWNRKFIHKNRWIEYLGLAHKTYSWRMRECIWFLLFRKDWRQSSDRYFSSIDCRLLLTSDGNDTMQYTLLTIRHLRGYIRMEVVGGMCVLAFVWLTPHFITFGEQQRLAYPKH